MSAELTLLKTPDCKGSSSTSSTSSSVKRKRADTDAVSEDSIISLLEDKYVEDKQANAFELKRKMELHDMELIEKKAELDRKTKQFDFDMQWRQSEMERQERQLKLEELRVRSEEKAEERRSEQSILMLEMMKMLANKS